MEKAIKLTKQNINDVNELIKPYLNGLIKVLKKLKYSPGDLNDVNVYFDATSGEIFASFFDKDYKHLVYCRKNKDLTESNFILDKYLNLFIIPFTREPSNLNINKKYSDTIEHLRPLYETWDEFYKNLDEFEITYFKNRLSAYKKLYKLNKSNIRAYKINKVLYNSDS
jgi:hypothetical protein